MKKKAEIKNKKFGDKCPFGLPMTESCKCAGSSVYSMFPLNNIEEEKKEKITKMNKRVLLYQGENQRCVYAKDIVNDDSVNCNFNDNAAGTNFQGVEGSPLYPGVFTGVGLDGFHSWPLGYYADNLVSRNIFFGLFSLVSSLTKDLVRKTGEKIKKII